MSVRERKDINPILQSKKYIMTADGGIDPELWFACAGPQKSLPPVGSEVAYFPQGHIEQVACFNNQEVDGHIPRYNLPAFMPCTLTDIQLSADPETDEVFATLVLCPMNGVPSLTGKLAAGNAEISAAQPRWKSNSFTKTLTVSDTSTHGGFSVPRRAAEECLPLLDKSQDPPTQDLIAKDLHGNEWKFRHIFRGQPKRHLLTSGWSHFVSMKRIVAGDSVVFLRSESGQLRVGVRRAPRQQQKSKVLTSPTMTIGVLAAAAHAATEKSRFSLIYNPRSCSSEFIVCYKRFLSGMKHNFMVGQRFKMTFEVDNSSDRRYTGTIIGMGDYDPQNWQNSPWKSLQVNWDEASSCERQSRVSPWEIGPFTGCAAVPSPTTGKRKRSRPFSPFNAAGTTSVSEDSASQPMTKGGYIQEKEIRFQASPLGQGMVNHIATIPTAESWQQFGMFRTWYGVQDVRGHVGAEWSQQEPQLPKRTPNLRALVSDQESNDTDLQLSMSSPGCNKKMSSSAPKSSWPTVASDRPLSCVSAHPQGGASSRWVTALGPSFSLANNSGSSTARLLTLDSGDSNYNCTPISSSKQFDIKPESKDASLPAADDQPSKIFGFPLVVAAPTSNSTQQTRVNDLGDILIDRGALPENDAVSEKSGQTTCVNLGSPEFGRMRQRCDGGLSGTQTPLRSYIKVYKQGAIGRSVDITKYNGYPDLLRDVQEMFDMKSDLLDKTSGWQLIYTDHEDDVLLVGDDPWAEFCACVRNIRVLAPGEASRMRKVFNSRYADKGIASTSDATERDATLSNTDEKNVAASPLG